MLAKARLGKPDELQAKPHCKRSPAHTLSIFLTPTTPEDEKREQHSNKTQKGSLVVSISSLDSPILDVQMHSYISMGKYYFNRVIYSKFNVVGYENPIMVRVESYGISISFCCSLITQASVTFK